MVAAFSANMGQKALKQALRRGVAALPHISHLHGAAAETEPPVHVVPIPFTEGPASKAAPVIQVVLVNVVAASTSSGGAACAGAIPARNDHQKVAAHTRGCKHTALAIAADPVRRLRARQDLQGNAYTKGSTSARGSQFQRWMDIARAAGFEDPFLFSEDLVYTVVGCLRAAGYRRAESFMDLARQHAIASGRTIPDATLLACARAVRAAKRGRGTAKQASPLSMDRLAALEATEQPLNRGGPMWPLRALLFASWWLLREIESSNVRIGHITVDRTGPVVVVRVLLSVSKTDLSALGATRSHQCLCASGPKRAICPACLVVDHLAWLLDFLELDRWDDCCQWSGEQPLFPEAAGTVVNKLDFVVTIEKTATLLQLPVTLKNGARAFTGHSPRASGAIHMASAGLELLKIQLFGRWGSQAFLLYVRSAPLARMDCLARETQAGLVVADLQAQLAEMHVHALQLRKRGLEWQQQAAPAARPSQVGEPAAILDGSTAAALSPDKELRTEFVWNKLVGGRVHTRAADGRTHCGWKYTEENSCSLASLHGKLFYPVCFELDPAGQDDDSFSDESSLV